MLPIITDTDNNKGRDDDMPKNREKRKSLTSDTRYDTIASSSLPTHQRRLVFPGPLVRDSLAKGVGVY
ncbi:hypothetical protein Pmani_033455 [Petrolisthes manimaculis]|uniref:Uncharacterized protein n=1 Tax=Petrolisthes manimaculis TaxID=1843537 RepID=A0AAE1NR07_9EUCA|nr:hypothetical protein Pmani_033455 [Petrolisthes manimaculis]